MTQYEYRVVPFIGRTNSGQGADLVAQQLASVINVVSADGWEFCQLGDVNIEVKPGCLGALFGAKAEYIRFDQLIFRRAKV